MVAEADTITKIGVETFGERSFGLPVTGVKSVSVLPECVVEGPSQPLDLTPDTRGLAQVVATLQEVQDQQARIRDTITCWNCRKQGHYRWECTEPQKPFAYNRGRGRGGRFNGGRGRAGNGSIAQSPGAASAQPETGAKAGGKVEVPSVPAVVVTETPVVPGKPGNGE